MRRTNQQPAFETFGVFRNHATFTPMKQLGGSLLP
jgi:hypothetical protein